MCVPPVGGSPNVMIIVFYLLSFKFRLHLVKYVAQYICYIMQLYKVKTILEQITT